MPWNVAGTIIGGILGLGGAAINASSQQAANRENIEAQERINQANLEHSNYWNSINAGMAQTALDSQMKQQDWTNEQYIESRDYDRALQQQLFQREDTAIQRAMQDATSAGFSPLAALGVPANAGQVVSSSSAPGSMVSNNQASVQSANQVAPHVQAATGLGEGLSSVGAMFATMAENMSSRDHQKQMQEAEFVNKLEMLDKDHKFQELIKEMEQEWLADHENQKHLYTLAEKMYDAEVQEKVLGIVHGHESAMQEDQQMHEQVMQNRDLTWKQSNNSQSRGLHDIIPELIEVLANGDSKLERWLRDNKQVISLLIEGTETVLK